MTRKLCILAASIALVVALSSHWEIVAALSPPEDTPEEILRTEVIIEARSPVDGKRLTAAEYLELQTQLQKSPPPTVNDKIRENVYLLRIRKTLLQFFPFLSL